MVQKHTVIFRSVATADIYVQIWECWQICCWGITRCPQYEAIFFCPLKTFSFKTLQQTLVLPWGNMTLTVTPFSLHDKVSDFVVSSDTLRIYTEDFFFFVRPKASFKPCSSELLMKWSAPSKKKGSYDVQWIRKCVCCRVCEVGVLDVLDVCWEQQCGNSHSNTRIKNSLMRKSKAQAHVELALNKALNHSGRP